ncbi:hypothetical protein [Streptomyces justiciae]|uniref:hypothetical protein n=1 Tax=Streptomyces justiciae TaxID=2780140 RepID=UPI001880B6AB|nr:hypothetical protein [Streptomyces justiciae]MBE8476063.1 hypothetical protein [Streptomyces justiciae]MCW8382601.1 hypothetical protein [Streptomyces justiciae]
MTDPEPLPSGSPVYDLPNVFLASRIAGALGKKPEPLGRTVVTELALLNAGMPLAHTAAKVDLDIRA